MPLPSNATRGKGCSTFSMIRRKPKTPSNWASDFAPPHIMQNIETNVRYKLEHRARFTNIASSHRQYKERQQKAGTNETKSRGGGGVHAPSLAMVSLSLKTKCLQGFGSEHLHVCDPGATPAETLARFDGKRATIKKAPCFVSPIRYPPWAKPPPHFARAVSFGAFSCEPLRERTTTFGDVSV